MEEVTIDASASWKPVSLKQEVKQEDRNLNVNSCAGGGGGSAPPPKRLKSVESGIDSPMSISNPSPPVNPNFKPPTPGGGGTPNNACTPNSLQGPKTPQCHSGLTTPTSGDPKFAVPSPVGMNSGTVSSQPQLVRQQSVPSIAVSNTQQNACHLNTQGMCVVLLYFLNI